MDSPLPSDPISEARLALDRAEGGVSSQVPGRAFDRWSRLVKWFRQRFGSFRPANQDSVKTAGNSKSEDDRAEFMKRKYAELMMSHNAWADELEEDDF